MTTARVEALHKLLELVHRIQRESSAGMCPGPALVDKLRGDSDAYLLSQNELIQQVGELVELGLLEFTSRQTCAEPPCKPQNIMFLVRVTAEGQLAISQGISQLAKATPAPRPPAQEQRLGSVRKGAESTVHLHQMLTLDQVFLALRAGVEMSDAAEDVKIRARALLNRGQEKCWNESDSANGPSLSRWASHDLPRLIRTLEGLW